jgi:hypothetical protein
MVEEYISNVLNLMALYFNFVLMKPLIPKLIYIETLKNRIRTDGNQAALVYFKPMLNCRL